MMAQKKPLEKDFTIISSRHQIHTRIDFILISPSLIDQVMDTKIGFKLWTGHAWISCNLNPINTEPQNHMQYFNIV